MTIDDPILRPGDTCWRIEHAKKVAVIIDAADYFATVRKAVMQAQHSVMFIGWDFDTRILLDPEDGGGEVPNKLGAFLNWVVKKRPELHVKVLKWDLGMIKSLGRGSTPLMVLDWMSDKRISFKLDGHHPPGAAHHQKIVVIDDSLAFCGGIDITADRWDTRKHLDDDRRRRRPTTKRRYGPWHDVSTAVQGDVAKALGELARERWLLATGEELDPPPGDVEHSWPEGLDTSFEGVDVAISRTSAAYGERKGVYEIEQLYLAAIKAARESLYIESQYFASRKISEAIMQRLEEPDGPDIVIVNPETADGWLEEEVMGASRAHLLRLVRDADRHGRFRIYTPVTEKRNPIYVHAKVMVVDDMLLRVGSSNLNNRSLGFDTECDLSIEVMPGMRGEEDLRARIVGLRNDLLAEHLDVPNEAVSKALEEAKGSLIGAVEALRASGRSLVPFDPPELNEVEQMLGENDFLDPERPAKRSKSFKRRLIRWWKGMPSWRE